MAFFVCAQTTYIPLWAKEGWLLDRMEIKAQTNAQMNLSTVKPYMRRMYVSVADSLRVDLMQGKNPAALTKTDHYNLDRFQANNSEYSLYDTAQMPGWKSRKPFLGFLWPTKGNMIEVNVPDFYLSVNPLLNQQQSIENDFDSARVFVNSKGLTARGMIANKIGFHFFLTDNQEMGPQPFRDYIDTNRVVPGAGYWKFFKIDRGTDYFDARGSVSWLVGSFLNMQFGYDQHFIGQGYRSLFLSNLAPPSLFLKFNSRWKKFSYTNLYTELFARTPTVRFDSLYDRKYMATHHLSYQATPWLTIGAFESVIFDELNAFKLYYLQPVIFLNTLFSGKESGNQRQIGFDAKANIAGRLQYYGQFLLNASGSDTEGTGKESWTKRHGFQLGGKYVDALGIANLDVQLEYNQVRPFTYSSGDSAFAYTSYRQPLGHALGANLREWIGVIRYQPSPRFYIYARGAYWRQGLDSAGSNFGANPVPTNRLVGEGGSRLRNNYALLAGNRAQTLNTSLTLSYELKENLFADLSGMYRIWDSKATARQVTTTFTLGLRWNMFRRDYDY
jgi:hypothetical protein